MEESLYTLELEAMYQELDGLLAPYENRNYEKDDALYAREDRKALRQIENDWKDHRRLAQEEMQAQIDGIAEKYDEGLKRIGAYLYTANDAVKRQDRATKTSRLSEVEQIIRPILCDLAPIFAHSRAFTDGSWLHSSTRRSQMEKEAKKKAQMALDNIQLIRAEGKYSPALILKYADTMDMDAVIAEKNRLIAADDYLNAENDHAMQEDEDKRKGQIELCLTASVKQWESIQAVLSLLNIDTQILCDRLPKQPTHIDKPSFDSFVSVDLETTGSLGSKSGDAPAQITEIGAVKVLNGQIVDTFSLLTNPGRPITPMSASITHITDEMVKDAPSVVEGLQRLIAFSEDLVMIGHDFWHCDLPLLLRCGMENGIEFAPKCFDTLTFASAHKDEKGLDGLSLSALCEKLGIEHAEKHRALGDALATARLYLEMREWEKG